jgi:hypothetical protein
MRLEAKINNGFLKGRTGEGERLNFNDLPFSQAPFLPFFLSLVKNDRRCYRGLRRLRPPFSCRCSSRICSGVAIDSNRPKTSSVQASFEKRVALAFAVDRPVAHADDVGHRLDAVPARNEATDFVLHRWAQDTIGSGRPGGLWCMWSPRGLRDAPSSRRLIWVDWRCRISGMLRRHGKWSFEKRQPVSVF